MNGKGQKNSLQSLSETRESPQYPLFVIEEGEQCGEGVGDGGRAVVVFEDLKHFKTLVVICRAGILKEETSVPTVLQRCPDLALPELAGKGIH